MVDPVKVVISAVDNTQAAIASATKGVQTLSQAVANVPGFTGLATSLAAFAGGAAIKSLIGDTISWAAGMDDLSEKTGASVEHLSALSRVARISGADMETVETGLIRLAKALAGADDEAKGAGHALAAIGLSAEALRGQDTAVSFKQIADALAQYEDGAGKTAIAQDLLGKQGAKLLPLLKDLSEESITNGKLTKEQAAAAETLEKAWNRVNAAGGAWAKGLVIDVMPQLASLLDWLVSVKDHVGLLAGKFSQSIRAAKSFGAVVWEVVSGGFKKEGYSRVRPLWEEALADYQAGEAMITDFVGKTLQRPLLRPQIDAILGGASAKPKKDLTYRSRDPREPAGKKGGRGAAGSGGGPGSVSDYDAILAERVARAIESADIVKAQELVDTLAKLDQIAAAGLDPAIVQAVRDDLTAKAYGYAGRYEGYQGVYFNGDATCSTVTDDFNTIHTNRIWNESARMVRRALIPKMNSRVRIDPETGRIAPATIADWDAAAKRQLDTLLAEGEIADYAFTLDPEQDVIAQGKVVTRLRIVPQGIAKAIEAEIGFTNPAQA